jgi:branched-subunit amino acid ABC-type transport system permease component
MDNFTIQFLNGLANGMLLFVMAAGLSLIFGQMNVVNLSHGAFYLIGSYIGYTVVNRFGNFWLALLIAPPIVGILGYFIERYLLRGFYGGKNHLKQVLLTFGIAVSLTAVIEWVWGTLNLAVQPPAILSRQIPILGVQYPLYRFSLIIFGILLALGLWLIWERTRIGAIVRAGVSDAKMVSGLGINIERVFAGVFVFGTMLATLSGVLGAPIYSISIDLGFEILILAIVVVVIGGLGSLTGAFWGALIIGMANTFGKAFIPEFSLFIIFAVMAIVLLVKPSGLFGLEGFE